MDTLLQHLPVGRDQTVTFVLTAVAGLLVVVGVTRSRSKPQPVGKPIITPPQLPFLGNIFNFDTRNLLTSVDKLFSIYGKTAGFKVGPLRLVFTCDPEVIEEVLCAHRDKFTNSETFRHVFGYMYPRALPVLPENDEWARLRKLLFGAVTSHHHDTLLPALNVKLDKLFAKIESDPSQSVEIRGALNHVLLDIFGLFAYGYDFGTANGENMELSDALMCIVEDYFVRASLPLEMLWMLPTPSNMRIWRAQTVLQEFTARMIEERLPKLMEVKAGGRQKFGERNIINALLLAASGSGNESIGLEQLHDNIVFLFFASFATTGGTIGFTLDFLARNKEVQSKLRSELEDTRRQKNLSTADWLTNGAFTDCLYLDHVIKESMRLAPVAVGAPRTALDDVTLMAGGGPWHIPKGTMLVPSLFHLGRDPEIWETTPEDVLTFRPERWDTINGNDQKRKWAYMPFGAGARTCIGSRLAIYETKAMVSAAILRYNLTPVSDRPTCYNIRFSLVSPDGIWLKFARIDESDK